MVHVVIYTDTDGVVRHREVVPRIGSSHYIKYHSDRGHTNVVILENPTFPDQNYHEAWELSGSTISVNMTTAKEIHRNLLRNQRQECFEMCDKLFIEAFSQGKDLTTIKARQQYLRDLPTDPAIDAATTTSELSVITIADWTPPIIKDLPSAS